MHEPAAPAEKSSPNHSSRREIVIYDGHCQFCRRQIGRLARWDRQHRLKFLSLHDPRVKTLFPELKHDELMKHVHLIDDAGNRYVGAAAFAYLSRRLPRLWPLAPFLHIPGSLPLWQWLYQQVAKRRR